jgi:hypothetical protein
MPRVVADVDEFYPVYYFNAEGLGYVIEVSSETLERWNRVNREYSAVQDEIKAALKAPVALRDHAFDSSAENPKHVEAPFVNGEPAWDKAVPYKLPWF